MLKRLTAAPAARKSRRDVIMESPSRHRSITIAGMSTHCRRAHFRRAFRIPVLGTCLFALLVGAEPEGLEVYVVDVEGGAATLIVNQAGESLLADAGNAAPDDRDAKRIYRATQQL